MEEMFRLNENAAKEKIVFLFPWLEISGGPVYFLNLAESLSLYGEYEVYYIDYANGVAKSMAGGNSAVKWITYEEPFKMPIKDPITLITPIYCAPHIPKLHRDSKILFINWHNYCVPALCNYWRIGKRELQQFLLMIQETNSVAFLDKAHWLSQNSFVCPKNSYQFEEEYIPAVFTKVMKPAQIYQHRHKAISIAVLGRISKDKSYSIVNLAEQLDKIESSLDKNLYIIGEGSDEEYLLHQCDNYNVKIHMEGTLRGADLERFLQEKVDILFGMGLSILEGAALSIPSVIIPHNIYPFRMDGFTFLQDSKGYALGWYDTQCGDMGVTVHSLQEVIDLVYGEHDHSKELGYAAYRYLEKNHVSNWLSASAAIRNTRLRYKEFQRFAYGKGLIRIAGIPVGKLSSSFTEDVWSVEVLGIKRLFSCRIIGNTREFYLMNRRLRCIHAEKIDGQYRLFVFGKKIPLIKI